MISMRDVQITHDDQCNYWLVDKSSRGVGMSCFALSLKAQFYLLVSLC